MYTVFYDICVAFCALSVYVNFTALELFFEKQFKFVSFVIPSDCETCKTNFLAKKLISFSWENFPYS